MRLAARNAEYHAKPPRRPTDRTIQTKRRLMALIASADGMNRHFLFLVNGLPGRCGGWRPGERKVKFGAFCGGFSSLLYNFIDDVLWPSLDLIEKISDVLTKNSDRQQLHSAEIDDHEDDRGPT